MKKVIRVLSFVGGVVSLLFSSVVMASTPLTTAGAAVSIADGIGGVIALFGVVITGLAVMWGIRKMIKTTNRS